MKITFLLPYASIAGGIRVAAIYAQKFTEMGHEVTVISQGKHEASTTTRWRRSLRRLVVPRKRQVRKRPPIQQLDFLGDRHIQLFEPFPLKPDDIPDADVIIATWWETAFAISELPPEKGRKFYLIQHHEVHAHLPHHLSHGSYYLPLKKVAISQWLAEIMETEYGDTDVALVPNSVDAAQFDAPERGQQPDPTVGLLYAKNPFKGVDISFKAIERARQRVPNLKVVAFSAKPAHPRLPLPAAAEFHLSPPQDRIRDIYASCDVWLMASRSEGFGLPLLEAMACRTPVISTRTGAAEDVIREGINGHIVELGDAEAMGDRIADLLEASPERWKAMSDAAYDQAQGYSWDEAARRFLAVLEAEGAEATAIRAAAN
jgi:glycosyltransferase involved in cell wall biosynthesis